MALNRFSFNLVKNSLKFCPTKAVKQVSTKLINPITSFSSPACRMFTTSKVLSKEQIEELQKNPFFDKYAEKIAKLQKTNPEEFLSRMEAKSETDKPAKPKDFSLPGTAKPSVTSPVREKSLNTIMKVELLADKTPEEIAQIWSEHYASKDAVAAVIPVETYKIMQERFKEFNTFLFPLPRDMGYEFMVVQFLGHEAHFSTLINYQAHKENAPECLSMVHYTELAEEKGIVLMVGEYDKDVINTDEARGLVVQAIQYYGVAGGEDKKLGHLQRFTYQTEEFNHLDLILELEVNPGFPSPA